jgi:hypothetical protein
MTVMTGTAAPTAGCHWIVGQRGIEVIANILKKQTSEVDLHQHQWSNKFDPKVPLIRK